MHPALIASNRSIADVGSGAAAGVIDEPEVAHVTESLANFPSTSSERLVSETALEADPLLVPPPAAWMSDKKESRSV